MKIFFPVLAFLWLSAAMVGVWAESTADLLEVREPPAEAPLGVQREGVEIGLWTEKAVYEGNEIRNVWILAQRDRRSEITIGAGGSLYAESFLHVTRGGREVAKIPISGGVDGVVDPTRRGGGISALLADLPAGRHRLVWKTASHTSNVIAIEIR